MENKKASTLIQNVPPGDWLSIWRILQQFYHPMGAVNKVELFHKFSAMKREKNESIMEFVQRMDSELTDLHLYGVEIPDEISINVLQQGAGSEYDIFIRMLIHQKATYENIKDELINYDFHSTLTTKPDFSGNQCVVNQVNTTKRKQSGGKWPSNKKSKNQQPKSNKSNLTCFNCGKVGHVSNECWSKRSNKSNNSNRSNQSINRNKKPNYSNNQNNSNNQNGSTNQMNNNVRCNRCLRFGHNSAQCYSKTKIVSIEEVSNTESNNSNSNTNSIYRLLMFKDCGVESGSDKSDTEQYVDQNFNQSSTGSSDADDTDLILIDSGANRHLFNTAEYFDSLDRLDAPRSFICANNQRTTVKVIGNVLWLKDVLYCPSAHRNIISLSCLQAAGFGARLSSEGMDILLPDGQHLLTACLVNGLYYISWDNMLSAKDKILKLWTTDRQHVFPTIDVSTVMLSMHDTIQLLHKRLGHISMKRIKHLVNAGYLSTETSYSQYKDHICDACARCKSTRRSFTHNFPNCHYVLERIHMDLQGPFKVSSLTGNNYIVGFIDAYSRMSFTYYVKQKSDVYDVLINKFFPNVIDFVRHSNIPMNDTPTVIISDNGEFKSDRVHEFLANHGIRQMFTCPYTPEHNGLIERLWRTLHTMASAMMNEKHVMPELWEEAHNTANYLYNRIPPTTVSSHGLLSPYQLFYNGDTPKLSHIRMFGSKAYVHTYVSPRKGFDVKATDGILVGYDPEHIESYRIYIPTLNSIVVTAHVTIDEGIRDLHNMYPFQPTTITTPSNVDDSDIDVPTKSLSEFQYLIGTTHCDDEDGMLYQTTRVVEENGFIVVYRRNVSKNGRLALSEDGPIHVRDIVKLTAEYEQKGTKTLMNIMNLYMNEICHYDDLENEVKSSDVVDLKEDHNVDSSVMTPGEILTSLESVLGKRSINDPTQDVTQTMGSICLSDMQLKRRRNLESHDIVKSVGLPHDTQTKDPRRSLPHDTQDSSLPHDTQKMDPRRELPHDTQDSTPGLTSSNTRCRADHPAPSSGTKFSGGSHDPVRKSSVNSLAGQALVFNLLESVYSIPEIRDKLMTCKLDAKQYVDSINRQHERSAANILRRRARQGDIVASLLIDNNEHNDILARYQSFLHEPTTHEEAMDTPDRDKWSAAEQAELSSLIKNKVFEVANRPKNRKLIPCKWIYRRKRGKDGSIDRFKARLVAKGFHQVFGQDFNETFSPVARLTTIRLLYSIAVLLNLNLTQLDVETAFLNAELPEDEQVFIEPPPLLELPLSKCYRLKRSLYGLKQSPRLWNFTINKFLTEIGFRRLVGDPCIYVKGVPNSSHPYTIISLYVDDLIVMSNTSSAISRVVDQLRQRFSMKDFGSLQQILGTEISAKDHEITMSQYNYALQLLNKHGYLNDPMFTPRLVPISPAIRLTHAMCPQTDEERTFMQTNDRASKYREILGALLWLAINTRPDLMYAVNQLSKFNNNPGPDHWYAMENVLRYLKGTLDLGLQFSLNNIDKHEASQLWGLNSSSSPIQSSTINIMEPFIAADADFCRDSETCKSVSGYIFMLAGAPISWTSSTQPVVAMSSMESEYIAACAATQEAMWLKSILEELGFGCTRPIIVQEDNKSTNLGSLQQVLGTEINAKDHEITMSQYNYAQQLLNKHGYLNDPMFTPRLVPISPAIRLTHAMCPQTDEERTFMQTNDRASKYREILGALLWLAINTRPDLMYAVNQLSKFNNNPGPDHWYAMENVLRYLKGTLDLGLQFSLNNIDKHEASQLWGLNSSSSPIQSSTINIMEPFIAADADFCRDSETCKSVSGYIFMLAGAPISWTSSTQPVVAMSSMESEYIAACAATQEAMWLKSILEELGFGCTRPIIVQEDNKSTIEFSEHPGNHRKNKHIQRRFHYVREQVQAGNVRLKHCKGSDNVADIFTKPLYPEDFIKHRDQIVKRIPRKG